ncbi:hypothetical protein [Pontibacter anaerobius]|uniref:Nucleotidyltransferase n=1 Tax=Pontibacter anaerobius TaxID=2993940 RepID=A0ABT3REH1_9BACT|nr:hypothetical protein [Pontibacter anaerobius]MCX2740234.1 hypothetical protein [Pontibacter anaerobius]
MVLARDFEDFIGLLNKHEVEYLVVGGYALAFHGRPRHTGDLDIWIKVSEENAQRMLEVLQDFGLASLGFEKDDFLKEGYVTQIGYPPLRIDILNTIDGVSFQEAYGNREQVELEGLHVAYIGLREFVRNKEAVGRARDLSDIKEIQAKPKLKRGRGRKL